MAVSLVRDLTAEFNASSAVVVDVNGWDYAIFHVITPTNTLSFTGSNDGGEVTGSTLPNNLSAANFTAIVGQDLSATASATYVGSVAGSGNKLIRFDFPCQFIKLAGSSITVAKLIMKLHKIH